jgi:Fe-S cluster assembly iron-binding protein IscA
MPCNLVTGTQIDYFNEAVQSDFIYYNVEKVD